jgi:hypothetical protein
MKSLGLSVIVSAMATGMLGLSRFALTGQSTHPLDLHALEIRLLPDKSPRNAVLLTNRLSGDHP